MRRLRRRKWWSANCIEVFDIFVQPSSTLCAETAKNSPHTKVKPVTVPAGKGGRDLDHSKDRKQFKSQGPSIRARSRRFQQLMLVDRIRSQLPVLSEAARYIAYLLAHSDSAGDRQEKLRRLMPQRALHHGGDRVPPCHMQHRRFRPLSRSRTEYRRWCPERRRPKGEGIWHVSYGAILVPIVSLSALRRWLSGNCRNSLPRRKTAPADRRACSLHLSGRLSRTNETRRERRSGECMAVAIVTMPRWSAEQLRLPPEYTGLGTARLPSHPCHRKRLLSHVSKDTKWSILAVAGIGREPAVRVHWRSHDRTGWLNKRPPIGFIGHGR